MSALWRRLILLLVLVIAVLQVIHMTLLSRLEAKKNSRLQREALRRTGWTDDSSMAGRGTKRLYEEAEVDQDRGKMLQAIQQSSVLDSSGEYHIINHLQRADSFPQGASSMNLASASVLSSKQDVTLVTQATPHNLYHLVELESRWLGPISIAVFAPSIPSVSQAVEAILRLRQCYPAIRQNVSFHLVYPLHNPTADTSASTPTTASIRAAPCDKLLQTLRLTPTLPSSSGSSNYAHGVPYPNNLLRNVARRNSASEFVFVLDVDLVPSARLHDQFLAFAHESRLFRDALRDDKTVYVVPAFEMREDVEEIPGDKASLLQLVELMEARPFYFELCWKCQKHTDYEAWQKEPPSATLSVLFEVLWRDPWEPFYIGRNSAPAYDERFRQYGFNRISQVEDLSPD